MWHCVHMVPDDDSLKLSCLKTVQVVVPLKSLINTIHFFLDGSSDVWDTKVNIPKDLFPFVILVLGLVNDGSRSDNLSFAGSVV